MNKTSKMVKENNESVMLLNLTHSPKLIQAET